MAIEPVPGCLEPGAQSRRTHPGGNHGFVPALESFCAAGGLLISTCQGPLSPLNRHSPRGQRPGEWEQDTGPGTGAARRLFCPVSIRPEVRGHSPSCSSGSVGPWLRLFLFSHVGSGCKAMGVAGPCVLFPRETPPQSGREKNITDPATPRPSSRSRTARPSGDHHGRGKPGPGAEERWGDLEGREQSVESSDHDGSVLTRPW